MKTAGVLAATVAFLMGLARASVAQRSAADTDFPLQIDSQIGDRSVRLVRTGSAIRRKGPFKVYRVASYLQAGVTLRSAEELAATDSAKQLHLIMVRSVTGATMARSFELVFRENHPSPAFDAEVKTVVELFQKNPVSRGDHVWLTHIPKVGLQCRWNGQETLLKNVDFSKAVWENYFGKHNVGEDVKRDLSAGLQAAK
jgi:hypothetical protein